MIDLSLKQPTPKGSVYERCYIIAANADPWLAVSTKFAEVFHAKGVIDSPVPRRIRPEEAGGGEIPMLMARDIFVKCQRAEKELNFRPVQETLSGNLAKTFDEYSL